MITDTTLLDLIKRGVNPYGDWAIYAEGTDPTSPARYGQTQFDNGGMADNMRLIIDGEMYHRAHERWTDGDNFTLENGEDMFEEHADEFLEWLVIEGWIE